MVKMDLGSSDSQSSSVSTVTSGRITAYETTMGALSAFAGESSLTGQAYDSAKTYANSVLVPLLKAAVLYEEGLDEAVGKLPSEYRNTEDLGNESLDTDILQAQLDSLTSMETSYQSAVDTANRNGEDASDAQSNLDNTRTQISVRSMP